MNQTEISTITVVFVIILSACCLVGTLTMLPGFILSALGKDRIGTKLIKFGAGCVLAAFSSAIVAAAVVRGGYWPVILLVVVTVWIILEIKRRPRISTCPHCNERITSEEKRRLYKLFGLRNPITCSHCGTIIAWSKWPLRLMAISYCLFFIFITFKFLKVELGFWSDVMGYITLLTLVIGDFTMKLEIID